MKNEQTSWFREISDYLHGYGLETEPFTEQVRTFFVESHIHHYRLAYRDAIARCMGLNMAAPKDRDRLWREVADGLGIDRKTRGKWLTYETDPPLDGIRIYFSKLHVPCEPPPLDDAIAPVRTAIARTLTYIRDFPPRKPIRGLPRPDRIPGELARCWEMLRRHVHYRKRGDLNQHALDSIKDAFGECPWIEADRIGEVRRRIESAPREADPIVWPWIIFKYATTADIISTNRPKANPHRWIWDDLHPRHDDLWSVQNG